jgi:hypothetical protein
VLHAVDGFGAFARVAGLLYFGYPISNRGLPFAERERGLNFRPGLTARCGQQ